MLCFCKVLRFLSTLHIFPSLSISFYSNLKFEFKLWNSQLQSWNPSSFRLRNFRKRPTPEIADSLPWFVDFTLLFSTENGAMKRSASSLASQPRQKHVTWASNQVHHWAECGRHQGVFSHLQFQSCNYARFFCMQQSLLLPGNLPKLPFVDCAAYFAHINSTNNRKHCVSYSDDAAFLA